MFPGNYKRRAPTIGIFTSTWKQSLEREVRNDVSLEEEGLFAGRRGFGITCEAPIVSSL
jgi:hypothetical protein